MEIMGIKEVAARLGWQRQQVDTYLRRADAKGFPPGGFPKPFQRISAGWLWWAADIEAYAQAKEAKKGASKDE